MKWKHETLLGLDEQYDITKVHMEFDFTSLMIFAFSYINLHTYAHPYMYMKKVNIYVHKSKVLYILQLFFLCTYKY